MTLTYEAYHNLLEDNGIMREFTKERMNGTYQRPAHVTQEFLIQEQSNYVIEYMKKFLDRYGPTIFKDFPGSRDFFLKLLKGNRIKLRKYPDVIKALFIDEEDQIPEDLRVEDNQHQSVLVQEIEQHMNRRHSRPDVQSSHQQNEDQQDQIQINTELPQNQFQQEIVTTYPQQEQPEQDQYLLPIQQNQPVNQHFNLIDPDAEQQMIELEEQLAEQKLIKESEYWNVHYDYLVKRTNDLGLQTFKEYIKEEDLRRLTRREQTSQFQWHRLGPQAEESDDSLKNTVFEHPLLLAKQKVHNQKNVPIKRKFKERQDSDIVSIDGKQLIWGDFKKKIQDQAERKAKKGEQIEGMSFILNQNNPHKEKVLYWNYWAGFQSENSEDERTNYNREERRYMRERLAKHGNQPYLRQRPLQKWEKMMLRFGGAEVLKSVTGKKIDSKNIDIVYEWVDPSKRFFFDFGDFLLQKHPDQAQAIYAKEKEMQLKVMDQEKWITSVFANELRQLYQLFSRVCKDSEVRFPQELRAALPKSQRDYLERINFQLFQSPPQSPAKSLSDFPQTQPVQFDQEDNGQIEQSAFADFDQIQENSNKFVEMTPEVSEIKIEPDGIHLKNQSDKKTDAMKIKAPKEFVIEAAKYIIPENKGPYYETLQKKLFDYRQTIEVDDYVEIKNLLAEYRSIDPAQLEEKFIPRLNQIIKESEGRIKGYYIWPHHRKGGMEKIYPPGRRYPKRLREFKAQPEDKPIYMQGIEVGYLIANVPYLHADTWKGSALPLQIQSPSQQLAQQNLGDQSAKLNQNRQNKKRKFGDALNYGVGMPEERQDPVMKFIEQVLPFLKYNDDESSNQQRSFNVIQIDKDFNKGTQIKVVLSIKANSSLIHQTPNIRSLLINNVYKRQGLIMNYKKNPQQKNYDQAQVNENIKVGVEGIWTLKNQSGLDTEVNIVFSKK